MSTSIPLSAEDVQSLMMQAGTAIPLYEPSLWIPQVPEVRHRNWAVRALPLGTMIGYWGQGYLVANAPVLMRDDKSWMSVTPSEIESQEMGCRLAYGHVVILGFGMGIAAANAALNPAVTAVTVIEMDPAIHAFAADLDLPGQLPPDCGAKLRMVEGDATRWTPPDDQPVDVILADYWLPLFDAGRDSEMRGVQANIRAKEVFFWGQELTLAWHLHRVLGTVPALDDTALEQFVAEHIGLPLLWPRGTDYGSRIIAAARSWLPLDVRNTVFGNL